MFGARAKEADLQTEANRQRLADNAQYQYRLTQIVLAFTMAGPK
jgi:hypothetical protein